MKHKQYEVWLLSDEPLLPEEQVSLREHLRECDACYLLAQQQQAVDKLFRLAPILEPAPGFALRWRARYELSNQDSEKGQALAMLTLSVGGAGLILIAILQQVAGRLADLPAMALGWIDRVLNIVAFFDVVWDILLTLSRTLPEVAMMPLWWCLFWIVGGAAITWAVSVKKLTHNLRFSFLPN